jgi:hypothetical protein
MAAHWRNVVQMSSIRRTYGAALQVTLRNTAAAYGYTLSTAATVSLLTERLGTPGAGRLFLFAAGGILAFALLEGFLAALGSSAAEAPEQAVPFAGALNAASVAAALGMAILVAHFIRSSLAWFLAPLGTTAIYMLVVAVQVTAVAASQRRGSGGR